MTDLIVGVTENLTIDSLELAKLSWRRHDSIKRSILSMNKDLALIAKSQAVKTFYTADNKDCTKYILSMYQVKLLAMALDGIARIKVLDRLEELEWQQNKLPSNYKEALLELVKREEEKELEKTKTYISDKKVATAMNTASQKSKEAERLKIELDKSKEYCTVKRMEILNHWLKFRRKHLKDTSIEMEIEPIKVFDANYWTVKAYHKDVWQEAYWLTLWNYENINNTKASS